MEQKENTTEVKGAVEKIRTKLKFIKSDKNGALISFVSQNPVNKVVCGVRQDSPYPKKIVIIDRELANELLVNVLYDCVLIPMTATYTEEEKKRKDAGEDVEGFTPGYIAIEANPVQFKAKISTQYIRGVKYQVICEFGNKVVRFDPFKGQKESVKSLPACIAILERRYDVRDIMTVVEDFRDAANALLDIMKADMRAIHNKKKSRNEKAGRGYRH